MAQGEYEQRTLPSLILWPESMSVPTMNVREMGMAMDDRRVARFQRLVAMLMFMRLGQV